MPKRVKAVAKAFGTEDEGGTKLGRPCARGAFVVFAFHVNHNDRVLPGEKLCGCVQALAMPGRRNDDNVAQFPVCWLRLNGEELVVGTPANQEVCPRFRPLAQHKRGQLMRMSKAGFMEPVLLTGNKRRFGQPAEQQPGAKAQV